MRWRAIAGRSYLEVARVNTERAGRQPLDQTQPLREVGVVHLEGARDRSAAPRGAAAWWRTTPGGPRGDEGAQEGGAQVQRRSPTRHHPLLGFQAGRGVVRECEALHRGVRCHEHGARLGQAGRHRLAALEGHECFCGWERGKQTGELTSARRLAPTRRPPPPPPPRRRVHAARRPRFPAPVSHVAKPQQGASTWGVPSLLC